MTSTDVRNEAGSEPGSGSGNTRERVERPVWRWLVAKDDPLRRWRGVCCDGTYESLGAAVTALGRGGWFSRTVGTYLWYSPPGSERPFSARPGDVFILGARDQVTVVIPRDKFRALYEWVEPAVDGRRAGLSVSGRE